MHIFKIVYKLLEARITQYCPSIRRIDIWNNQPDNYRQEDPEIYPAAFIEFTTFAWTNVSGKGQCQTGEGMIRVHVVTENYADSRSLSGEPAQNQETALKRFEIAQEVHNALQGYSTPVMKTLERKETDTDLDHDAVIDDQVVYATILADEPDPAGGNPGPIAGNRYDQEAVITDFKVNKKKRPEAPPDGVYSIPGL